MFTFVLVFIVGTIIGSFITTCVYRIPKKQSIISPASHCTLCGRRLKAWELIPILSYFFLMGKCKNCKGKISITYPLIELTTGLIFLILLQNYHLSFDFIYYLILTLILFTAALIDLYNRIIPNKIIAFGFVMGLTMFIIDAPISYMNSFKGFLLGGGVIFLIAVISKGGMGGGDIKLMALVGMFLGCERTLLALVLTFLLGGFVCLGLVMFKIKGRKDYIPFGPFISAGSFIAYMWGSKILNWYFDRFIY